MPRCCGASLVSAMDGDGSPQSLGLQIHDGNPRNKTALAPGHSLMDWIRLGNSGVDLTGVGGVPRIVSMTELAEHNKRTDAWIAIRGIVFNVTRYMDFHPGGVDELMKGVGKDATKLFENVHAWVNYQSILQKCVVGRLNRTSSISSSSSSVGKETATANSCSPSTLGLISSCTKQNDQENKTDSLPNVSLNWRQTTNSLTIFFQNINGYTGVIYDLIRINDSKLNFKLTIDKDIISYDLELAADVEWPPTLKRDFTTMEVEFTFSKKEKNLWKCHGSHTLSKESSTESRTYREYEVVTNLNLCKLVNFLVLRSQGFLGIIPAGRHLEAKMNVMGMEVSRSYTPVPPCLHPEDMVPNYADDCICLMIKKYPDGALSPSITALQPGQTVTLSNALGAFVVESFDRYTVIHLLAAGTGLTAFLAIIQRALAKFNIKTINLVNFNKDQDNIFYSKELDKIATENKLKVTHILSQPLESWTGKTGKISDDLLKDLIGTSTSDGCVFTCGPKGFMETAKKCLQNLNWKSEQMYEFDE
ncbi:cytochrome b5 reductase 4 isoform X2 [Prorops nasuta]|uniref:cytochrome b5 reductase 4 isoform X2 n=1 Tax=Prorops nasuta TaxID=863751 RepID=UPI0034CF514F